ncbi:MAG: hypothetical protein IJV44_02845 [Prevotella sp.]|nr:hypothetical protein [Prevotella sp.]
MDKEQILQKEAENNGQTIYLYYDSMAGMYLAFGLSAYYTTMVTEPYVSYSEEMKMPVALLRRQHILFLRQSLKKIDHQVKGFYVFQLKQTVGDGGYAKWSMKVQERYVKVLS